MNKVLSFILVALFGGIASSQTLLNVTNFGAIGDATNIVVTVTSNSFVLTTGSILSSADVGKSIEVFGCGTNTYGVDSFGNNTNGHEDMVCKITNVVSGTNIYIDGMPFNTLTNTFCTYGHNNQTNFQNCINSAIGNSTIISIPTGRYLLLATWVGEPLTAKQSLVLYGGGIHFIGTGTNNTVLLGEFAWAFTNGFCRRGFIFDVIPPITNDFPVSIQDLTLDGGVQVGNTLIHGTYPNPVDGLGWDGSHGAYDIRGLTGSVFSQQTWSNVLFTHWRGEIVKSNDGNTNGNLTIEKCTFTDGNATAINIYASLLITNCVFNSLFQVGEYYMNYNTGACYIVNCLMTNIDANGFAFNGANGHNPPFYFNNNSLYMPNGFDGILMTPGDNITISNNQIIFTNGITSSGIVIGAAGYQGTFCNSNIVIVGNTFYDASTVLQIAGDPADDNQAMDVWMTNNIVGNPNEITTMLQCFNWTTNVYLFNNDCSGVTTPYWVALDSGAHGGQFALVGTNNIYNFNIEDDTGKTNFISYENGANFVLVYGGVHPASTYVLVSNNGSQMPSNPKIVISNSIASGSVVPIYMNSAMLGNPVNLSYQTSQLFVWNQYSQQWQTNSQINTPIYSVTGILTK